MEKHHEEFLHFVTCIRRLHSALETLRTIRETGDSPLVGPAFRFALVEYATPYNCSYGANKRPYRLKESYIPVEYLELHQRILDERNTIHAHADMNIIDATLYVTETRGTSSATFSSNYINELEEIGNIEQIISLIEGTLLSMYADQNTHLSAL